MSFIQKYAGVIALVAIVIAIGAFARPFAPQSYSTPSTIGTSLVPTTLSGGSVPSLFSALEAGESFISDGPSWFMGTTTWSGASTAGTVAGTVYENKGGRQYAYTSVSLSSTSSIPVIFNNPFGTTASTSVDAINCNITNPSGSFTLDISTTTLANSTSGANGSSTPALVVAKTIPANAVTYPVMWRPFLATSSTQLPFANALFSIPATNFDGSLPFTIRGTEVITLKIATSTPGTYVTYPSGTCDIQTSR